MSLSALLACPSLALSPKQRNFLSILLRGRLAQHTTVRDHIELHTPGGLEFGVLSYTISLTCRVGDTVASI